MGLFLLKLTICPLKYSFYVAISPPIANKVEPDFVCFFICYCKRAAVLKAIRLLVGLPFAYMDISTLKYVK